MTEAVSKHQKSSTIKCITILVKKPLLSSMATEKTNDSGTRKSSRGWGIADEGWEM